MSHEAVTTKPCTKPERWFKVNSLSDVKSLPLSEFQIFAHHCMSCPVHEVLLNKYENLMHSHLERTLVPVLGINLSF